jgi:hypothetical protein
VVDVLASRAGLWAWFVLMWRKVAVCGQTMCLIVDIVLENGLLWLDLHQASRNMMRTFVRVDCPEEEAVCC